MLNCYFFPLLEGSATESGDYNEPQVPAEEEIDDEENIYFDTTDFLSSAPLKAVDLIH
jgi:oxysterol-binding protein 1